MTKNEYMNYIYYRYVKSRGVYMYSPDQCYELINDRVRNYRSDYSSYNKHYRIKW